MALDDHIIDIYLNIPSNLVRKHFFHQAQVGYPDVLEAEWHLSVSKGVMIGMEGCFLFIFFFHLDLVVAFVGIEKTLELESF